MGSMSLQEEYAPKSECFGCGPANEKGLRIRSMVEGDKVVCRWNSEAHHEAFPGMLNGGIIGSVLDCHSNWTAAYHIMKNLDLELPPCTVTANYKISLLRPTPSDTELYLEARVIELKEDRALIQAELIAGGQVCAKCEGLFVSVKPGHPAYHRW